MEYKYESIFSSSIRSFCKSLGMILGLGGGLVVLTILIKLGSGSNLVLPSTDITIMPDADNERTMLNPQSPVILRLDIHGLIGSGDNIGDKIQNLLLASREGILKKDRVKAILLHIDSPGGYVKDSESIYQILTAYKTKFKIPIYAYVEGICASAALFIACSADKIYASDSSVIGSVGVFAGPYFNLSQLLEKYGIQSKTLKAGKDKDSLSPFRPWSSDEGDAQQAIVLAQYQRFVSVLTNSRPHLDKEKLIQEYGARVFIDKTAQELGYIDHAGATYSQALAGLAEAAQLTEKYQVIRLNPQHLLWDGLTKNCFLQKTLEYLERSYIEICSHRNQNLYLYQPDQK